MILSFGHFLYFMKKFTKHELKSDFYNNAYMSAELYKDHYTKTPYRKMWEGIIQNIKGSVADFGCGVGQFAEMCIDSAVDYSYGVDFSEVAIELCNRLDADFFCADMYGDVYDLKPYDTAVILETFEHVDGDLEMLSKIPSGKNVIISVPNWDASSHVRYFKSVEQVRRRYKEINPVVEEYLIGNQGKIIYVAYGIK